MSPLIFVPLPGNEAMAAKLAEQLGGEVMAPVIRNFPDGETYLRFDHDLHGRSVALVCSLDRPDIKFLPLLFAAGTMTDLGAARVGLVAPYLAYMRQDRRFEPGEALTAKLFASYLSRHFDWLVTVDPHLHRIHALDKVYSVPSCTVHAAGAIAQWIAREVPRPVLIGPDRESVQWVSDVAAATGAPVVTLSKTRHGDQSVDVAPVDFSPWRGHTPVLIDDIISTGQTMIETMNRLREAGMKPPVCVGVHAIFAGDAYADLLVAGPARIATTDTIPHATNAIDISRLLANAIREVAG